jgi:preprotein translocase subunit SecG
MIIMKKNIKKGNFITKICFVVTFFLILLQLAYIILTTPLKTKVLFAGKTQEKQNQEFSP